jgi:predicted transposase/invertase (TIGR01784 family)
MNEDAGKYINPFTDFGFKKIFGEEANKELLIDFLNTLIADNTRKIVDITYLKNEHLGRNTEDRKTIFDLYCETGSKETFIVEMQKAKQTFFKDRTLYYVTFPIQAQAKKDIRNIKDKSKNYAWDYKLTPIYSVAIMDFVFDDSSLDKVKHDVMLMDVQDHQVFYDKLRLIYLEMPHFTKGIEELETQEDKWLFVLKNLPRLEEMPEKLKNKIFTQLFEAADMTQYTPQTLAQYHDSLRDYRDLKNSIDTYLAEGLAQGLAQGLSQGLSQAAINAIKKGFDDATIQELTNLSLEDIAKLRKEIEKK